MEWSWSSEINYASGSRWPKTCTDPTYLDPRNTAWHTDLKDGTGSWQAYGLLHQSVQNLVSQVVGRPNKKKTVLRIQISGESISESELFKEKKKKNSRKNVS